MASSLNEYTSIKESLTDDAIKYGIESALYDVKIGKAYVEGGISEEDYNPILKGDQALIKLLFKFVARRMGAELSPQNKKRASKEVRDTMRSQGDKWFKVVQEYDGTAPANRKEKAASVKKESDGVVDMDVDAKETLKKQTDTPKPPKAESDAASAVVTGTSSSGKTEDVKEEPTDMDIEPTVKVESEDKPAAQDTVVGVDGKGAVKEEPMVDVKQESKPDDGESKPETDISDEKQPADMEADDKPVKKKKKSETPQKSKKKRKSDDGMDDKTTPRKKAKGSKSPRKLASAKKKKAKKNAGPSEAQLEAARETAKREFEAEKAEVLDELSDEYKSRWGQVGYGKWSKSWLPCLVVGPFDVGAGTNMREEWMSMYENTRGRRHQMTNLVYWYGTSDLSNAFSFLPAKDFIVYDKAVEKGLDKYPKRIQSKLDSGKKLTKADRELVSGQEDLKADLLKQPQERVRFDGFIELYQDEDYVLSLVEEAEDSDDELISSDDGESLVSSASSSSELESDSDDDDEMLSPPKTKKVKKKKADEKVAKKPTTVEPREEEMSFAEDEVSSDDSKDADVELSDGSSSDDEQDEDYITAETGSKKRKPGEAKKKKAKKDKSSAEGKKAKTPKEKKPPTQNAQNRAEHKKFRENKEEFLPILEEWKTALKNEDLNAIDAVLQDVLGRVDKMGAPFIEEYNISPLMTATKKVLREKNADRTTQKKLMTKLGEQHKTQKALVLPSFTLKNVEKKKSKKKDVKGRKSATKPKREDTKKATEPASLNRNESANSLPGSLPGSQSSSSGPATPARRVQSQGSAAGTPRDGKISPKPGMPRGSTKAAAPKSEKTSFSLSSLFNKPTSSQQSKSDAGGSSERQSSHTALATKSLPSWMTKAPPDDAGQLPSEEVDRLLALEFFEGTASCFPEGKVNREAIARSLESAVYQWSLEQYKKEDAYWPKVHAVVSGICGKKKPGTLLAAIMAGEYKSARDVVTLSDEMMLHSFEGSQ